MKNKHFTVVENVKVSPTALSTVLKSIMAITQLIVETCGLYRTITLDLKTLTVELALVGGFRLHHLFFSKKTTDNKTTELNSKEEIILNKKPNVETINLKEEDEPKPKPEPEEVD